MTHTVDIDAPVTFTVWESGAWWVMALRNEAGAIVGGGTFPTKAAAIAEGQARVVPPDETVVTRREL